MKTRVSFIFFFCYAFIVNISAADLFVEAESFAAKGGWVVDQQFADLMGSPYMMAHGMGVPVKDASTTVLFPKTGAYSIFVRTFNWTSPWFDAAGPGRFSILIDGKPVAATFGNSGKAWMWQDGGTV